MSSNAADFEQFFRPKLISVYETLVQLSPEAWSLVAFGGLFAAITGWRLTRFTNPELPRVSPVVRDFARWFLLYPSVTALTLAAVFWGTFFGLCWTLDSVNQGIRQMGLEIVSILVGAVVAMPLSALVYYLLIPSFEHPAKTLADPSAKIPLIESYDPERYFHV